MFLHAEGYRNHPKHSQTSFWVQWIRMDASKLWYPEIVHSGPKHEFFIFDMPRVSEMLWNTSKHHFGSYGLEWMLHNFSTPEIVHLGPNTQVLQVFMCRRLAKSSEILARYIGDYNSSSVTTPWTNERLYPIMVVGMEPLRWWMPMMKMDPRCPSTPATPWQALGVLLPRGDLP
jgi:hypothetical protein